MTSHTKRKAILIGKIFFIVHILKKIVGWNFVLDQVERLSAGRKTKYLYQNKATDALDKARTNICLSVLSKQNHLRQNIRKAPENSVKIDGVMRGVQRMHLFMSGHLIWALSK